MYWKADSVLNVEKWGEGGGEQTAKHPTHPLKNIKQIWLEWDTKRHKIDAYWIYGNNIKTMTNLVKAFVVKVPGKRKTEFLRSLPITKDVKLFKEFYILLWNNAVGFPGRQNRRAIYICIYARIVYNSNAFMKKWLLVQFADILMAKRLEM